MFKIEIPDINGLYESLKREYGIERQISQQELSKPIHSLETRIYTEEVAPQIPLYSLITEISCTLNKSQVSSLFGTQKCSDGEQPTITLDSGKCYYSVEYSPKGNIRVTARSSADSLESFKKEMEGYVNLLEDTVNAIYEGTAPDITYVLEIPLKGKFSSSNKEPKKNPNIMKDNINKSKDSDTNSMFGDPLDTLEKKLIVAGTDISFDMIGGLEDAKEDMLRIYSDIVHPEIAQFFGRDPEKGKGYLLLGEAGTGKTMLVRALANKLMHELGDKVKVYHVKYSDITSIYRGGEAQGTDRVFELVRRNEEQGLRTLLFFDELHIVGQRRREYNEALDTLLANLGGMESYNGLTVIGATYLPLESLDPALVRPGRLGKHIRIPLPNEAERLAIFNIYLKQKQAIAALGGNTSLFAGLDLQELAKTTEGFTPAQISGIVQHVIEQKENEICRKARKHPEQIAAMFTPITQQDLLAVIGRIKKKEYKPMGFQV